MKFSITNILFCSAALLGCKAGQSHNFIDTKKERKVVLTGVSAPRILFVLESGDTIKFSSSDVNSILDKQVQSEIKRQGYLSNQSFQDLSEVLKGMNSDTLVFQNLSAVSSNSLGGVLDTWIARELLLKGNAELALKGQSNNPKKLTYIFTKDNLGGQQGTFYTEDNKKVYWTIIALGE